MQKRKTSTKANKRGAKQSRNALLTPTVIQPRQKRKDKPKGKRGVKTPSNELRELIEMANLAGKGKLPYQFLDSVGMRNPSLLLDKVMQLPDPPKSHLLELMNRPERWRVAPKELIEELGFDPEIARLDCQFMAIRERYNLIQGARSTLESVVSGETHFPATVFIVRGVDHKARYAVDEITRPLIGTNLRDIRRCAVCEKFFFVRRDTSAVCDPESPCAATYSKRQERKNKKLREEQKKKRAEKRRIK
ncbi:MAG: hypothetical protein ABJB61_06505 [bacterium]